MQAGREQAKARRDDGVIARSTQTIRQIFVAFSVVGLSATAAWAAPNLNHMRAVHFTGNYGPNVQGIKTAVNGIIDSAPVITASTIKTQVSRGSSTNSSGVTTTADTATVTLTKVVVGSASYDTAVFRLARNVDTGVVNLSINGTSDVATLAAIPGFTGGQIQFSLSGDGKTITSSSLPRATGAALQFVEGVVANGAALVQAGTFTLNSPATFDATAAVAALQTIRTILQPARDEYWQFLKAENVNWIGVSVGIFYDSISDPTVRVEYAPATLDNSRIYTFDDTDLQNFIVRAKSEGLKVYLTLAFEPGNQYVTLSGDPKCKTAQAKPGRNYLGDPVAPSDDPCIDPSLWWWNPTHPSYTANVATFWSSYTQVAVKYAQLAQQWGVDMYSLGTETENLFRTRSGPAPYTNNFKPQLTQMVNAVRAVYSGLVTYDQIFNALQFPFLFGGLDAVLGVFPDLGLDVVGISAYFQLTSATPTSVLTVSQLETDWETVFQNYFIPLQTANPGRPIVFTEFGYTDDLAAPYNANQNTGNAEPTLATGQVSPGMQQQQNIYQAFFNVDDRHNNLVKGIFSWGNGVFTAYSGYCNTIGWNFYCKPVADTITANYARWASLEAVRPSAIFSTAQSTSQSFLRLFNTGASPGTATVALYDYGTGQSLGQWTSPSIPGGAELQYAISTIEAGAGVSATKPSYYSVALTAGIPGYFQHVLFRPADGTLTNLSTCDVGVTADPATLSGVHTSLLSSGFPSTVVVNNTATAAAAVTLGIYDARDGSKLGTYTTAAVPANGQVHLRMETIEAAIGKTPTSGMYHYVIKAEGAFSGFLQHLVNNTQKGVITDMTTACTLDRSTSSAAASPLLDGAIFSTAQSASQSFLRFFNTGTKAGTVTATLRDYATGQSLGQWTSPSIPAGAEFQYFIGTVESGISQSVTKPNYYSLSVTPGISGYYQHVLYRPADGTLTNLSTCAAGVTADSIKLSGVHSTLLNGFPSMIVVNNTATTAATVALGIYDARDGSKLGTYTTASLPANGQAVLTMAAIETGIGKPPASGLFHYVIKAEGAFTGFLQHLVNNTQAGVVTDMTTACAMAAATP